MFGGSSIRLVSTTVVREHPLVPKANHLPVTIARSQGQVEQSVSVEKRSGASTQGTSALNAVDASPLVSSKSITTGRCCEKWRPKGRVVRREHEAHSKNLIIIFRAHRA